MSGNGPGRPDDDQARWEAATQVCEERPSWAVIWLARKGAYRARAAVPGRRTRSLPMSPQIELITFMDATRQAIGHQPKRPARV